MSVMPLAAGFSIGMALLLLLALATVYRHVELPWPSRAGGFVMLSGLALTQLGHLQMPRLATGPVFTFPRRNSAVAEHGGMALSETPLYSGDPDEGELPCFRTSNI